MWSNRISAIYLEEIIDISFRVDRSMVKHIYYIDFEQTMAI